jgi:single-strand DNA-binding protein
MNLCTITGNIGRDAESRTTTTGKTIVSFSVGDSPGKDKPTMWWAVNCWLRDGDRGDVIAAQLTKGRRVTVTGQAKESRYTGRDGVEKTRLELSCEPWDVSFVLDGRGAATHSPVAAPQIRQQAAPSREAAFVDDPNIPF